jgi:hypothetical protein
MPLHLVIPFAFRLLRRALVLVLILLGPAHAAETSAPGYDELVARLKGGDTNVDFAALREAYARSPRYDPYASEASRLKTALFDAFAAKDCPRATDIAAKILETNYVNIDAHLIAGRCYGDMGDAKRADFHQAVARGLLAAIAQSGDGESPETAFVVIAIEEEYSFLRAQGYEASDQALVNHAGRRIDRIEATDADTGDAVVVFFDVERPLSWLEREVGQKKP